MIFYRDTGIIGMDPLNPHNPCKFQTERGMELMLILKTSKGIRTMEGINWLRYVREEIEQRYDEKEHI